MAPVGFDAKPLRNLCSSIEIDFFPVTRNPECAGISRHVEGVREPYRKGSSESILAWSLAGDIVRCRLKRGTRGIGGRGY